MILVEVAGFLGADAEERFTANGKRVISLRIGAKIRVNGKDETLWWRVNIWDDRFDKMLPYLKKGSSIIVIGEMGKPEIYTAKDGTTQVSLSLKADIVRFSPFGKPEREGSAGKPFGASQTPHEEQFTVANVQEIDTTGDDLPF